MQHVLVVDDEADLCRLVQAALERGGYRVSIALSGKEALPLLEEPQPDLLIADAVLPGMSGVELAELAAARQIPVLLTTENEAAALALRDAGWALLRKPFRPATLLLDVAAALCGAQAERERASEPLTQVAVDRSALETGSRQAREPRSVEKDAQMRSLLEEDQDTVRAAFHMIENFGARAASVADQRARTASADDVAKRWNQIGRAIRKLRPKL